FSLGEGFGQWLRCTSLLSRERCAEGSSEAQHIRIAMGRVFGSSSLQHLIEGGGQIWPLEIEMWQRFIQVYVDPLGGRGSCGEWFFVDQNLVQYQPQSIDIGTRCDGLPADLFRRDVGQGANQRTFLRLALDV